MSAVQRFHWSILKYTKELTSCNFLDCFELRTEKSVKYSQNHEYPTIIIQMDGS